MKQPTGPLRLLSGNADPRRGLSVAKVWVILFSLTLVFTLLIQLIVLPVFLGNMHAGRGVMAATDGQTYDRLAQMHARVIREEGWSHWRLIPDSTPYLVSNTPLVGIASAFYAAFVPELWVLSPLSAALHATSGSLVYVLLLSLVSWPRALVGCLVVSFLPSTAQWYSQLMRDEYSILGFVLFLLGWVSYVRVICDNLTGQARDRELSQLIWGSLCLVASGAFLFVGRPYLIAIVVVLSKMALGLLISGLIAHAISVRLRHKRPVRGVTRSAVLCSCLLSLVLVLGQYPTERSLWRVPPGQEENIDVSLSGTHRALLGLSATLNSVTEELSSLERRRQELEQDRTLAVASDEPPVGQAERRSTLSEIDRELAKTKDLLPYYESYVVAWRRSVDLAKDALDSGLDYEEIFAPDSAWARAVEKVVSLQDRENWLGNQRARITAEGGGNLDDLEIALAETAQELAEAKQEVSAWGRFAKVEEATWRTSWYVPRPLDAMIQAIARNRHDLIAEGRLGESSGTDLDVQFSNVSDFLRYIPRAAQLAFLAPFPDQWFGMGYRAESWATRRIAGAEMCLAYLAFASLLLWGRNSFRKPEFWTIAFFSCTILILYGAVVTSVGSLYRMRAPFFLVLVSLGIAHARWRLPHWASTAASRILR